MFYYYGRKKRISKLYPEPLNNKIIEPFAGSAAYSLHGDRWENEVILYDTSKYVSEVWNFLLSASKSDIETLPETLDGSLSLGEKYLIGFHLNPGSAQPKLTPTKFNRWAAGKKYIAENIHKIKHWKFINESYKSCVNEKATWFIDPPYQNSGGKWYVENKLDYKDLANWIKKLKGQIISCDSPDADYLTFKPLLNSSIASIGKRKLNEGIFYTINQ